MTQPTASHTPFSNSEILEKVIALTKTEELESLGATLSPTQFLDILFAISHQHVPIEKLSPLLVGVSNETFSEALYTMPAPLIEILRKESSSEPLLHHLTLFVHNCQLTHDHFYGEIQKLKEAISHMNWDDLGYQAVYNWHERIQELGAYYINVLESVNKALVICWSSERIDLIERLSSLKEHAVHQLKLEVGFPNDNELPASGLMMLLKTTLESIFTKSNLQDEDPAIEGLVSFSVWYLKDYWDVGLLPEIATVDKLEAPADSNEYDKIIYKQKLFHSVTASLEKLGLRTVDDLKKAGIYSRKMLKEYIAHFGNEKI